MAKPPYVFVTLDVLQWYRKNKSAIAALELPADQDNAENARSLDNLRESLKYFDRAFRGVQDVLKGVRPEPDGSRIIAVSSRVAMSVLAEMAERLPILTDPLFATLFDSLELNTQEFENLVEGFFFRKLDRVIKAYSGASYRVLPHIKQVRLQLQKGKEVSTVRVDFDMPNGEGLTLRQQFDLLRQVWKDWKAPIDAALKDPSNWPVVKEVKELSKEQQERNTALALAQRLASSLSMPDRELLHKYPEYFPGVLDGVYPAQS